MEKGDRSLIASKLFAIELELYGIVKILEKVSSSLLEVGVGTEVLNDVKKAEEQLHYVYGKVKEYRKRIENEK